MRLHGFTLDPFQVRAIELIRDGHSVLVSAPTGTGKTIVADQVVQRALEAGRRVIYTAPVKALSNQKFRDYTRLHGEDKVGLVTGDLVIRRDAPCLVMTTEILRNMLLDEDSDATTADLEAVILDEIHFLDDRERGTVWEEVLIYLPPRVRILGLSATLSNLEEFAAWLSDVRGEPVHVVEERQRAVPLEILFANHQLGIVTPAAYDRAFKRWQRDEKRRNAALKRSGRSQRGGRGRRQQREDGPRITRHTDLFNALGPEMAPYLYFVFSRRLAEQFARGLGRRVHSCLLPPDRRGTLQDRIDEAVAAHGAEVIDEDLEQLYRKGIAFHHAGLHVQLKALVEELYEQKLIAVLYTTSTFALGINMPARTVVLDGVLKYDGQGLNPLTVRQFMQKAGRAGRRGMDDQGYAVVRLDFPDYLRFHEHLEAYLRGQPERVDSSFNLSFNSVVCLLDQHPRAKVREIVERSFLAWRMRHRSASLHGQVEVLEEEIATLEEAGERRKRGSALHRKSKELRKARRSLSVGEDRAWRDFEERRAFLVSIGYLDDEDQLLSGARVLRHLRIEEIFATELVLSGLIAEWDAHLLFGVLCGMTNRLAKGVQLRSRPSGLVRRVAAQVDQLRQSQPVLGAEAITGLETTWDPAMILFGQRWSLGSSLAELQLLYTSPSDISGQLISGFRRAKDLAGQILDVYREDPYTADPLRALIRRVSRDEVEVLD
ncbi:MAG: DEAD/DEAH box helicase [Alphaproteobacteria bacterium]|nr:DEAD/DEAH box helicase [Alphaproteobacteria bacterium]